MDNKKKRVVLIHGVNIHPKRNNLRRLAPAFRDAGFCVLIPTYGYLPAFLVGVFDWLDRRIAESMSEFILPNDILVGHSNGSTLIYMISQKKKLRGAVLISAALEVDKAPNADFVHVYYNQGDIVAKLSALLPWHPWGAMGGVGYLGTDPRVVNIDEGNPPDGLPLLSGHSDIFKQGKARPWSKYIAKMCLKALGEKV